VPEIWFYGQTSVTPKHLAGGDHLCRPCMCTSPGLPRRRAVQHDSMIIKGGICRVVPVCDLPSHPRATATFSRAVAGENVAAGRTTSGRKSAARSPNLALAVICRVTRTMSNRVLVLHATGGVRRARPTSFTPPLAGPPRRPPRTPSQSRRVCLDAVLPANDAIRSTWRTRPGGRPDSRPSHRWRSGGRSLQFAVVDDVDAPSEVASEPWSCGGPA
jgi:hypothetical protein